MVRDIIVSQKSELEENLKQKFIHRETTYKQDSSNLIKVIIGPRRAGKSFFGMHQIVKNSSFGFVNFDDERLIKVTNFDEILQSVLSVYSNPSLLFFDEIQNMPEWEIIVNRLQRQGFQLILTGSNSNLLGSELATHLTGRHLPVYIFSFSFKEYLSAFETELTESDKKEKFNDFLISGGYPEPFIKSLDYRQYLQILFDSILFKDIVKRHNIRHATSLENLASWLISNITCEFSLNSLSNQLQFSSIHTTKKYLSYLEQSFVFFSVSRFSFKVGEQQRSNKKIYCFDNGFYKAKAFHFSPDWGKLLENAIASALFKRSLENGSRLFFWKNSENEEVDFVVQTGTQITQLIQVCWDTTQIKTRQREIRSLLMASEKLQCTNMLLLTREEESIENFTWFGIAGSVKIEPAWKWLLNTIC